MYSYEVMTKDGKVIESNYGVDMEHVITIMKRYMNQNVILHFSKDVDME